MFIVHGDTADGAAAAVIGKKLFRGFMLVETFIDDFGSAGDTFQLQGTGEAFAFFVCLPHVFVVFWGECDEVLIDDAFPLAEVWADFDGGSVGGHAAIGIAINDFMRLIAVLQSFFEEFDSPIGGYVRNQDWEGGFGVGLPAAVDGYPVVAD